MTFSSSATPADKFKYFFATYGGLSDWEMRIELSNMNDVADKAAQHCAVTTPECRTFASIIKAGPIAKVTADLLERPWAARDFNVTEFVHIVNMRSDDLWEKLLRSMLDFWDTLLGVEASKVVTATDMGELLEVWACDGYKNEPASYLQQFFFPPASSHASVNGSARTAFSCSEIAAVMMPGSTPDDFKYRRTSFLCQLTDAQYAVVFVQMSQPNNWKSIPKLKSMKEAMILAKATVTTYTSVFYHVKFWLDPSWEQPSTVVRAGEEMLDDSFQFALELAESPVAYLLSKDQFARERLETANQFLEMLLNHVEDSAEEWGTVDRDTLLHPIHHHPPIVDAHPDEQTRINYRRRFEDTCWASVLLMVWNFYNGHRKCSNVFQGLMEGYNGGEEIIRQAEGLDSSFAIFMWKAFRDASQMPDASVAGPNLLSWQPIIRSHLELEACKVSYYCLKSDYNQAKRSNEMRPENGKLKEWAGVLRQHGYTVDPLNDDEDLESLNLVHKSVLATARDKDVVFGGDLNALERAIPRPDSKSGRRAGSANKRRKIIEIDT